MVSIATGTSHTCAVHRDGTVSCWGYGPFIGPRLPEVTAPVPVPLDAPATGVAVGIQAACALVEGGQVRCWGDLGEGNGPTAPAPIVGEDGADLAGVTQLAGGSVAFCGLTAAGTHCWGDNKSGELARPPSMTFPPRTAVLAQPGPRRLVAATVAVLVYDGVDQLCGWGNNDSGITPGARQILTRPACAAMVPGFLQLSAGDGHACARRGGRMFSCWGSNSGGQLGRGDEAVIEARLPGALRALPADVQAIAAGAYHTCALLATGGVMCWGSNNQGECGVPSSAPLFAPVPVTNLPGRAVAIGAGAGAQHTCVVLDDGAVACWGNDNEAQLGSGATTTSTGRFSPRPTFVRW